MLQIYVDTPFPFRRRSMRDLNTVLNVFGNVMSIPFLLTGKGSELVVPVSKEKECSNYSGVSFLIVPGRVLVHKLLMHSCSHLLKLQGHKQLGFALGKSAIDRILSFCVVLVVRLHKSLQVILAASVDLRKAFDSNHLETSWKFM